MTVNPKYAYGVHGGKVTCFAISQLELPDGSPIESLLEGLSR